MYKEVLGYSNYKINRYGDIKNLKNINIKPYLKKGYLHVGLSNGNGKKIFPVHGLVAINFLDSPVNDMCVVNHKDGNKLNNYYKNLEWVTVRENTIHAYENSLSKLNVNIKAYDLSNASLINSRSIQNLSKLIGVDDKIILSSIRNSKDHPLNNRYVFELENEEKLINNLNSLNFGKKYYIYDLIKETLINYNSKGICLYMTGIRSLFDLKPSNLLKLGFIIDTKPINPLKFSEKDKKEFLNNRLKYISKPYNIKKNKVVVINYLDTGKTRLYFDTKKDFYNYMLEKTNTNLNLIQLTSIKYYNNYKFYRGIMYQFYNNLEDIMDWGCISLQKIYNSKFNIPSNSKLYKLEIDGTICYVRGLNKLANMLKSYIKTEINNIVSVEDLKSNLNQNNITIEDCDKIIIKI